MMTLNDGSPLRRALALAFAGALLGIVGACNTVEGMGEDLEAVGSKIDEEAEQEQRD